MGHSSAKSNGVVLAYNCELRGIERNTGGFIIDIRDVDGGLMKLQADWVINAAGLFSDSIAEMAGIDVDQAGYRLYPCKGEYFSVSNRHKGRVHHLVYPAPTAISLGIHTVNSLQGGIKLGPNAFYVDAIDYDVDRSHREGFFSDIHRFLPFIERDDLSPDMAGIRAKLQGEGEGFRDFVIAEESANGIPGLINCIGIESPGLASCLAIAEKVASLIN